MHFDVRRASVADDIFGHRRSVNVAPQVRIILMALIAVSRFDTGASIMLISVCGLCVEARC